MEFTFHIDAFALAATQRLVQMRGHGEAAGVPRAFSGRASLDAFVTQVPSMHGCRRFDSLKADKERSGANGGRRGRSPCQVVLALHDLCLPTGMKRLGHGERGGWRLLSRNASPICGMSSRALATESDLPSRRVVSRNRESMGAIVLTLTA